jgi:hypothetical protein
VTAIMRADALVTRKCAPFRDLQSQDRRRARAQKIFLKKWSENAARGHAKDQKRANRRIVIRAARIFGVAKRSRTHARARPQHTARRSRIAYEG